MKAVKLVNLALSLCLVTTPVLASTMTVNGGTYYNAPGGNTKFSNPGGTIQINSGQTVRGLETGTNNGGHLIFNSNIMKLDGNIDVSAIKSGSIYLGNGGRVDINANILLQNGNIYANGTNGGFVNINVGSMTMGPNARIEANGVGGFAGQIKVNATDSFTMQQGSVMTANGIPIDDVNFKNIEILASIVNIDGVVQANGVKSNGGVITLVSTNGDVNIGANATISANGDGGEDVVGNGGTINITSNNGVVNNQGTLEVNDSNGFHVDTNTQTVVIIEGESGTIGKFNTNASPDNIRLNDLQVNESQSYTTEGFTKNINGGVLETPDITVTATYFIENGEDQVRVVITDENNNVLFDNVYNVDNKHDQHITFTFDALFTKNEETTTVQVTRDFNVTVSKLDNNNNNPNANVVLLPQHEGGDFKFPDQTDTVTTTTETVLTANNGVINVTQNPRVEEPPVDPPNEEPPMQEPPTNPPVSQNPKDNNPSPTNVVNLSNYIGAALFPMLVQEGEINDGTVVIIGFENEDMFFDPRYQAVLNEIMDLAFRTYNQQIANGATPEEAFQTVNSILIIEGFSKNVAFELSKNLDVTSNKGAFLKKQFDAIQVAELFNRERLMSELKLKRLRIKVPMFVTRFGGYTTSVR